MTETPEPGNDYVATAAAEKRLREVLAVRFSYTDQIFVDGLADMLLAEAQIGYKPRTKEVTISLKLPDKAAVKEALDKIATGTDTRTAEELVAALENAPAVPAPVPAAPAVMPGIMPFVAKPEPEDGYADGDEFQYA